MQYMASGFAWTAARKRIDYHAMIAAGVLTAAATGVGAWLNGKPFMTSAYGYVSLWPLEEFELATAALFDAGVFMTVLGAVMLALASLARIAQRAGEVVNTTPYDIDPQGRGDIDPQGRGDSDPQGRGDIDPQGRGDSDPQGRGDSDPQGRGDSDPQGRGDIDPQGRGDIDPQGRGDKYPQGRGDKHPQGRGDKHPQGGEPRFRPATAGKAR
jgi:hypothetical protein